MDKEELSKIAKEVHMSFYKQGKFGREREEIKEICRLTGVSKKEAKEEINKIMHPFPVLHDNHASSTIIIID